jgi:ABC-type Fe3+/spermidine/putrescine transport system ATPase subunit
MVYVTHDQEEALTLSDRIAVMRAGRIEQCADPESIYTRPRNLFVATFIGDMNILFGALRGGQEWQMQLETGPSIPVPAAPWARPGVRCALGVRPEHVDVRPAAGQDPRAGDPSYASLPATVAGAVYLGESWFYDLTLAGGGVVRAKRPVDRGAERLAPGSVVNAGWHIADASLLEA